MKWNGAHASDTLLYMEEREMDVTYRFYNIILAGFLPVQKLMDLLCGTQVAARQIWNGEIPRSMYHRDVFSRRYFIIIISWKKCESRFHITFEISHFLSNICRRDVVRLVRRNKVSLRLMVVLICVYNLYGFDSMWKYMCERFGFSISDCILYPSYWIGFINTFILLFAFRIDI